MTWSAVDDDSFEAWLGRQQHRDDPVGDLARDAQVDPSWPEGRRIVALHEHLTRWGASDDAHRSLERAWREWEMELDREASCVTAITDAGDEPANERST